MPDQKRGLTECVSTALGGMIGDGIFAVLGVVAQIVHGATWVAFVAAAFAAYGGLSLWQSERQTFYSVLVIAVAVLLVELLCFEREAMEEELPGLDAS